MTAMRPFLLLIATLLHAMPALSATPAASRDGERGEVLVSVLVNVEGRVQAVKLHRSSGLGKLDQEAMTVVRSWRFRPGRRDGKPVPAWVVVPVSYRIDATP